MGSTAKTLWEDRETRNAASYRPTRLLRRVANSSLDTSALVCSLWRMCEPYGVQGFVALDQHLVRLALESTYLAAWGRPATQAPTAFARRVQQATDRLAPPGPLNQRLQAFLGRASDPTDPLLVVWATRSGRASGAREDLAVISRAALLVRLATGSCQLLLRNAGVTRDDIGLWVDDFGLDHGLWSGSAAPSDLSTLWDDIVGHLEDTEQWLTTSSTNSTASLWTQTNGAVAHLGGLERALFWGLGL